MLYAIVQLISCAFYWNMYFLFRFVSFRFIHCGCVYVVYVYVFGEFLICHAMGGLGKLSSTHATSQRWTDEQIQPLRIGHEHIECAQRIASQLTHALLHIMPFGTFTLMLLLLRPNLQQNWKNKSSKQIS